MSRPSSPPRPGPSAAFLAVLLTGLLSVCGACRSSDAPAPSAAPAPSDTADTADTAERPPAPLADPLLAPTQIAWERSVEDAVARAQAEHRPLLVALNVDGESASDRIVAERYRDPAFVAWTRRFVCLIGHPYRHAPRDHDELGRRVPCPRLGSVTCGEHMALEPQIFDRWLGGERVSPRHALVLPDGTKAFDLFYLFDLGALDRALEEQAAAAPADPTGEAWFPVHGSDEEFLDALAAGRAVWQRAFFEEQVARLDDAGRLAAVRAIGRVGDAGSVEALRLVLESRPPASDALLEAVVEAAGARGIEAQVAGAVGPVLRGAGTPPGALDLGANRRLLALFARGSHDQPAARTLLLALRALGAPEDRAAAAAALAELLSPAELARIDAALAAEGGALELADLLALARELGRVAPRPPAETARTAEELLAELEAADAELAAHPQDPAALKRFGAANLRVAQDRIQNGGPDAGLLLDDAARFLAQAAAALPEDDELALERARAAYFRSDFAAQERIAGEVVARRARTLRLGELARGVLGRWPEWGSGREAGRAEAQRAAELSGDDTAIEALRWLGDASARLVAARAGGDAAIEAAGLLRGGRALARAAASAEGNDVDAQSLASFLDLVGLRSAGLAALGVGIERNPEAQVLRDALRDALWSLGRIDALGPRSDAIAAAHPGSAACAWYAGYGWFLQAEARRREMDGDGAIAAYDAADARFARSIELEPGYADSAGYYLALGRLGRGFAHLIAGRRAEAADALVAALHERPAVGDVRDGLDREALDLVDGALEWTAAGPSPVQHVALAERLLAAVPGTARWVQAVADSGLREALRADGRSQETVEVPPELARDGAARRTDAPDAEGDGYLEASIAVARRALEVEDTQATRRTLAQSLTVMGERLLLRRRTDEAAPRLEEAARLLGLDAPAAPDFGAQCACARALRERLGPARPVARPGR